MNKKQLIRHLTILNRDLVLCSNRMWKISQALEVEENTDIKKVIAEVKKLIEIGDNK